MIRKIVTNCCPHCPSANSVKNGYNPKGKQQYRCKQCGKSGVLDPEVRYTAEQKERILAAYYERPGLRGIERVFGVARETVAAWLKKAQRLPPLSDTLLPVKAADVLELDEMWSFVFKKANQRWL